MKPDSIGDGVRMEASVNINDYVWVKLTLDGEIHLRKHFEEVFRNEDVQPSPNVEKTLSTMYAATDGWTRFLLHDFMMIFGETMYMGSTKQMIEGNLISLTGKPYHS